MEPSSWSQRFLYRNGERRVSPIVIIFAAFQLLLIIVIVITISQLNNDDVTEDNVAYNDKIPEFTVKDLKDKVPALEESDITNIQKKIFKIVSENASSINVDKIEATIRDDSIYFQNFGEHTNYLTMLIDIPSLEQSYEILYSSNAVLDPEVSTFVLCPGDGAEKIYKNFKCKTGDDESIRNKIVPTYLEYFNHNYDYFSAYVDADDPHLITISPSVSFDNTESTKKNYINEVKVSIESLGVSSDSYEYYVRTADDVNYDNDD